MPIPDMPEGVFELQSGPWRMWVIPFGARIMQIWHGQQPLILGFQDPVAYRTDPSSMGAICGRYGNRIEGATLHHQGQTFVLDANEGAQCLHGGRLGFGMQDWHVVEHASEMLALELASPDGQMGWPGQCLARVQFQVSPGAITCEITAEVDRPCPLNLIQHNYWNLGGAAAQHHLWLPAEQTWDNDAQNLPRTLRPVSDGDDFQSSRLIGERSFDRTYMLPGQGIRHSARLSGPAGRLDIYSDQPSIQLYTAAHMAPTQAPLGAPHDSGNAVCLETQQLPNGPALDAPVWVRPGQRYSHHQRWEFKSA